MFKQRVDELQRQADGTFALRTKTGQRHYTRTVIIAAGRGITELQKLDIEGANRYELTNLYYTVQDLNSFRNKHVLISGGGNSAVDWALELAEVAERVTVVHRSREFRAMERNVASVHELTNIRTPYQIIQLHGQGEQIRQVTIAHMTNNETERFDVDAVIISHGYSGNYGSLLNWGLNIGENGLLVNEQAETNVAGIFGAGDCVTHKSKVRLIAGAFNDAALAINSAKRYLDPEAPGMAYVSSHNERFRELNKQLYNKK